jgi:hypothetical protein
LEHTLSIPAESTKVSEDSILASINWVCFAPGVCPQPLPLRRFPSRLDVKGNVFVAIILVHFWDIGLTTYPGSCYGPRLALIWAWFNVRQFQVTTWPGSRTVSEGARRGRFPRRIFRWSPGLSRNPDRLKPELQRVATTRRRWYPHLNHAGAHLLSLTAAVGGLSTQATRRPDSILPYRCRGLGQDPAYPTASVAPAADHAARLSRNGIKTKSRTKIKSMMNTS